MRASRRLTIGSLALGGFCLAACGSSAPSTASYDSSANKICATYIAKANALAKPSSSSTVAEVQKYLKSALTLVNQENSKLAGLKKPSSGASKYSAVYATQAAETKKLATAADATTVAGLNSAINSLQAGSGSLDSQFDAVGLKTCGSG